MNFCGVQPLQAWWERSVMKKWMNRFWYIPWFQVSYPQTVCSIQSHFPITDHARYEWREHWRNSVQGHFWRHFNLPCKSPLKEEGKNDDQNIQIRISKLLDITIFLETVAVHRSVSCLILHLLSYGSLLQWPSKSLSHYCSPVLWQPLAVTLQKPILLLLTYSRHRLFRRSSNPLKSNCLPLFKANFYAATLYLKAALLCLTTGRSFLLKKGLLTILSPDTQNTHTARLGVPPPHHVPTKSKNLIDKTAKFQKKQTYLQLLLTSYLLVGVFTGTPLSYFPSTV